MATETATAVEQEFKLLALDLIQESKTNPRKTFDPKQLEDLTASIKEMGVIVPILVRPNGAKFEVVAGARRFRAAKKAGLNEIQAIVRELSDDAALEAQVIENLQRADVHPLEEAEGYQALLKRKRHTVDSLATQVGKSVSYIWQRIKLTELIEPAKKAFLADEITAGHAVLIARLQPADQKVALENCFGSEWRDGRNQPTLFSVRTLAKWIQDNIHLSLDGAPWAKDDATLLASAGACTVCPKRAGCSPDLWPEVTRAQTCTDRTCFKKKLEAHVDRKAKELESSGKKVLKISENYRTEEKGVLASGLYNKVPKNKKRCDSIATGFIVDGARRGETMEICADAECRIHRERVATNSSGRSNAAQSKYEKERQKEIVKERATERARLAILDAVLEKTKDLSREDLESVAQAFIRRSYFSRFGDMENGPKEDLSEGGNFGKASDRDLARFLVAASLHDNLRFVDDAHWLYEAAKRRKVDVKQIEKRALEGVIYDRSHKERMQRWKGLAASGKTRFEILTCQLCGRTEPEQAKGGWHWIQKNDKSKCAKCNDCDRLEKK